MMREMMMTMVVLFRMCAVGCERNSFMTEE